MILTQELIHRASTTGESGWNYHQLKLLGVPWPPKKGWISKLVGKEITDEVWEQVQNLSGIPKSQRRALVKQGFLKL